jgi:hypothetical protein
MAAGALNQRRYMIPLFDVVWPDLAAVDCGQITNFEAFARLVFGSAGAGTVKGLGIGTGP